MRIRIEFQGPGFVAVPNHVAAMVPGKLSAEALGVLVCLALLPVGSDWNVSTVLNKCGLGRRAWERVSRELRAVGALFDDAPRGADGTLRGRVLSVRWPAPLARSARAKKPVTEQHVLSVSNAQKPKRTKRVFRSSQSVELIEEKPVECAKPAVPLKTKTGEAVAVAPTGGKAAAASPVCHFVPISSAGSDRAPLLVLSDAAFALYLTEAQPGETRQAWLDRLHGGVVPSAMAYDAEKRAQGASVARGGE